MFQNICLFYPAFDSVIFISFPKTFISIVIPPSCPLRDFPFVFSTVVLLLPLWSIFTLYTLFLFLASVFAYSLFKVQFLHFRPQKLHFGFYSNKFIISSLLNLLINDVFVESILSTNSDFFCWSS